MANIEDMRYVRTEEAIRTSFMDMVTDEGVASITVSALCRNAGISRNAFYLHHPSINALFHTLLGELLEDVHAESSASAQRLTSTRNVDTALPGAIISAFAKREKLLRALLRTDDGALAKQLAEGLEKAYNDAALLVGERGGTFEHRINCAFAAWAHIGLVTRWIAETDRPLEEALPLFDTLQAGITESATRFLTGM